MNTKYYRGLCALLACVAFGLSGSRAATPENLLTWNQARDVVDADVRGLALGDLLERVAAQTGWQIYVEPDTSFTASVKFKQLPSGEALRRLLGDLNFALIPQTNASPRLYVFRTSMQKATQRIRTTTGKSAQTGKRVPNELIVRLRPGASIDELARKLGAKVVGRIPELDAYRLQFADEAATEAARGQLAYEPDVTSVQDNYYVDVPTVPQSVAGMTAPENKLTLDPPKQDGCKQVVVFVDTALQSLGTLEAFVKERISVAGESVVDNSQPTHATAMANAFYQAMQASGRSSTSVSIISVNVFGNNVSANTFNVAAGMIAGANRGGTVINASLGGYGDSPILRDAVQQLALNNIPVFAAVGNDGSTTPFFPAAYPQVISVTAVERGQVAAYANVGVTPDAGAPGSVVFSYNGQTYGSRGTSVSSAAATGVAAGLADATCAPWSQVIPSIEKTLAVPAGR